MAKNLTAAAQAVTDKFFTGIEDQKENVNKAAQTAQEGRQEDRKGKSSTGKKEAQERRVTGKGKKTDDTKVFSFRSWIDDVDSWRSYAAVKGMQIDELGAAAMNDYIKRHPISAEERTLQEAIETVRRAKK